MFTGSSLVYRNPVSKRDRKVLLFYPLMQIMGFSPESVAAFIAVLGLLSIVAQVSIFLLNTYKSFVFNVDYVNCGFFHLQTVVLSLLMRSIGNKNTILLGLGFQILQLAWYGFGSEPW